MNNRIPVRRFRKLSDMQIEKAAAKLSEHTGESREKWARILRWRVRHFKGALDKALRARDAESGEAVFDPI